MRRMSYTPQRVLERIVPMPLADGISRSRSGAVHDCFLWFAQSIHSRLLNSNECRVVVAVAYGTKVGVVGNTTRVESYVGIVCGGFKFHLTAQAQGLS